MICKYCGAEVPEQESVCPACHKNPAGEPEAEAFAAECDAPAEVQPPRPAPYLTPAPEKLRECAPMKSVRHSELLRDIIYAVLMLGLTAVICFGIIAWKNAPAKPEADPSAEAGASGIWLQPVTELAEDPDVFGAAVPGADTVIAKMGETELKNQTYLYYYWDYFYSIYNNMGDVLTMYLDFEKPFDQQLADEETNWHQYIGKMAVECWSETQTLCAKAREEGYELKPEEQQYLDTLGTSMEAYAASNQYGTAERYLQSIFDPAADLESYQAYVADTLLAGSYADANYQKIYDECFDPEATMLYCRNVRHILFQVKEDGDYPNMEAAKAKAEEVLAQWQQDPTEDNFAALAEQYTMDPGSQSTGGLYQDVTPGQMVTEFNDWCFDEARQPGDTGIVETSYGAHIMYYVGQSETVYQDPNEDQAEKEYNLWMDDLFSGAEYTAQPENAVFHARMAAAVNP